MHSLQNHNWLSLLYRERAANRIMKKEVSENKTATEYG
jgi:hypothetical protein